MASEKNGKNVEIYTISASESIPSKKVDKPKKFWHIDKEMLRFKIHYFLFSGAWSICFPYIPIFGQKRIGISASSLAAILTAQRCFFILAKPSIGYIADYFKKLKVIICVLFMGSTIFLLLLLPIPKIDKGTEEATLDYVLASRTTFEPLNTSELYLTCEVKQNNSFGTESNSDFENGMNHDTCFPSLINLSSFLNKCSDKKSGTQNAKDNSSEIIMEQDMHGFSLPTPHLCKVCCKFSGECQVIECEIAKNSTNDISNEKKHISDFQTYQFWLYAFLTTASLACTNNVFSLTDTACCDSIEATGANFGHQRLWGSFGWGLMAPVGGIINDYTGDFLVSWIVTAIVAFISVLNMTKLKLAKPQFSKNLLKDIGAVLSSKEFLAFKLCVVMNGIATGIVWFYLVWFLTEIGGSRFLCGLAQFFQCFLGEIPFMFFSGWVINKIGHFNVQTLALMASCIRFFWYSQLHNPWLALPAEFLNGFTEGLFYTSVASFAKLSAKPGTEATTQALLVTAHEGVGIGIGCILAGIGFDTIGSHRTFLFVSVFAGCAAILSIILHFLIRQQKGSINVSSSKNKLCVS